MAVLVVVTKFITWKLTVVAEVDRSGKGGGVYKKKGMAMCI